MPRTKRGGKRGNFGGGSPARGGRRNRETSFVPFNGTASARRDQNGFTLQDEARNTERHQSFWNTDQRLRDAQVTFVSAGTLDSTKPRSTEDALAEMTLDPPGQVDTIEVFEEEDEDEELDETEIPSHAATQQHSVPPRPNPTFDYVVDVHGGEPVQTGMPPPRLRSVSPVPSDSSDEVLYGGRDRQGRGISRVSSTPRIVTDPIEEKIRRVEDKIHKQEELLEEVLRHKVKSPAVGASMATDSLTVQKVRPDHQNRGRRNKSRADDSEEAALIADYIANIDKDDRIHKSFTLRELGAAEDDIWQDTEASSGEPVQASQGPLYAGWNRSDICDFDDMSTSDGVMGDVREILSKRDRVSGVQYLVVWEGQTVDEARWVPTTTLTSVKALAHIEAFEADEKLVAEFIGDEEEDTSDSDALDSNNELVDDAVDNEDLTRRKIGRMSDEKTTRLLAKQEELGMGSSELILFDDDEDDNDDVGGGDDDIPTFSNTFSPVMLSSEKSSGRGRGSRRPRGDFPSATIMADAYDGFDVMDFDRPSLKRKSKGRKGKLSLDVSDSELEASMQMAWDSDRLKKKERKQEREELRAQGLLGSKNRKADLKQKYKEGMGIHAVREEIKEFLMGSNSSLSLPPMDKADRKVVHELANAFKLKSKSAGNGNTRHPIMYRTARTSVFTEHTFNAVQARLTRRYLPRMDVAGGRSGMKRTTRGGGFNSAAVSYRDGDIVGGSAPELGAENKGRAMLEKMGWSSGTALGALNNKGILQPVSHVVKTTKAGLG